MRSKWLFFIGCFGFILSAFAQGFGTNDPCKEQLLAAEEKRMPEVYSQCGFDDKYHALIKWSSWTQNHNMYQAMYELCVRYGDTTDGAKLCKKAIAAGNGPALLYQGDQFYKKQNYVDALSSYARALQSPMLTDAEKGHVAENIGVLYLDPRSSYYNPSKGIPVLQKAAEQRAALANNILGVYSMLALEKQPEDMEKAFKYLWRSILLGCPNAEENLGIFHLVRQKKISPDLARQVMQDKIFTCQSDTQIVQEPIEVEKQDCDCARVLQREELIQKYPYRLISSGQNGAVLQDKDGERISVTQEMLLPNGMRVSEIHKSAIILMEGKKRHVINLAPSEVCVQICTQKQDQKKVSKLPQIKPYRLSFSPSECSDLLYYAERLVDTSLPFTGKKECGFSGKLDEATQLLLGS